MNFESLELKHISKNYLLESGNEVRVLDNVNLKVGLDEVVAILGPSGSGKTTFLRILSGLLKPTDGEVLVNNKLLDKPNPYCSMVFQSFALLPWETVYSNIEIALKSRNLSKVELKSKVKKAIDLVGLEGFEEAYPRELSGGMKQRAGIARAIVMERPLLFLDEPFSAIDNLTADTLRFELINIWKSNTTAVRTVLLVTHNISEAVYMAKRILVMGTKPGVIRQEIINDLPYPRDEQSPGFQKMVHRLHELIAETFIPDKPTTTTSAPGASTVGPKITREPPIETLPNIQIGEMIGLLEVIGDQGGSADIFELAKQTGKDFGTTLYLAKAAELLELLETPRHMVKLTELGKKFVEGDINARKRILHDLFGALKITQMTTNLLKTSDTLRIPVDTLHERAAEWLPNENPDHIVQALISWGRFSEYFGYNDDTKEIYLDLGQEIT